MRPGGTRFAGAGELREKESDRLHGLAEAIRALGGAPRWRVTISSSPAAACGAGSPTLGATTGWRWRSPYRLSPRGRRRRSTGSRPPRSRSRGSPARSSTLGARVECVDDAATGDRDRRSRRLGQEHARTGPRGRARHCPTSTPVSCTGRSPCGRSGPGSRRTTPRRSAGSPGRSSSSSTRACGPPNSPSTVGRRNPLTTRPRSSHASRRCRLTLRFGECCVRNSGGSRHAVR